MNNSSPCVPWDPKYLTVAGLQSLVEGSNEGKEVDAINNDIKVPYSDQFSLGIRNRFGDWNTSATVVRVNSHDGFVFTLGGRHPDGAFFGPPPARAQWGQSIPGFGGFIIGNSGIETRSTQVLLYAEKPYTQESGWGVTIAYTHTNANENRDINEHYAFDYPTIGDYPFILSGAAPENRLVATGVVDGPWGLTFAGKLTLATPIPWSGIACYGPNSPYVKQGGNSPIVFSNGSYCEAQAVVPTGGKHFLIGGPIFGYRDVDLAVTKNWNVAGNVTLYGRLDVLNVFNYKNFANYRTDFVGGPGQTQVEYNTTGAIVGVPRTIKFTVGMRW